MVSINVTPDVGNRGREEKEREKNRVDGHTLSLFPRKKVDLYNRRLLSVIRFIITIISFN